MKNTLHRNIGQQEVCLEAIPTLYVLAFILWNPEARDIVMCDGFGMELFFVTTSTSLLTAAMGLAKSLLYGPCRILSQEGPLSGQLTVQYLLAVLSCLFSIVAKLALQIQLGGKHYQL